MNNYIIKKRFIAGVFFIFILFNEIYAQNDTTSIQSVRAASGVDPINIKSRILFTSYINNPNGPAGAIRNSVGVLIGVRRWYIGMYGSGITVLSGVYGDGFKTGAGDFMFTLQNRFYMKGKNGLAITGALVFPTGKRGFGSQYFSFTPVLTYLHAFNPSFIIVVLPQYTFHLMKDPLYPPLRLLSARAIAAKFTKTGYAYGLESKPAINLEADQFSLFLSPFLSKSLGAEFYLQLLCDIPVNRFAVDMGPTYQFGIHRNFSKNVR